MRFIRIATQMFPAERIANINTQAKIGDKLGVEVTLHNVPDTFQYTGEFASLAYDLLQDVQPAAAPPGPAPTVVVTINGAVTPVASVTTMDGQEIVAFVAPIYIDNQPINPNDIEWVDFEVNIKGLTGVEMRLATDPAGLTHQYTGSAAEGAYDALIALASNTETTATA